MASVLVRNIEDDVKTKLQARAKRNGHSLEAELRIVLKEAVVGEKAEGFGTRFAKVFAPYNLTEADFEPLPRQVAREPIDFSK
jgi:antitoxin FitA